MSVKLKIIPFLFTIPLLLICLFPATSVAQIRVVVIPMGGEDAISHPVATTYTNTVGMQFNQLPAGSFIMGSPDATPGPAEPGRSIHWEEEHTVTLSKGFRMQVTEVTNAQWNAVVDHLGLKTNPSQSHSGVNYPVESVNWFEAAFFANHLSTMESLSQCYTLTGCTSTLGSGMECSLATVNANCTGYSLPTEAQWEYAARATTTKAYANPINFDDSDTETGNGFNGNLNTMGWYAYNRNMYNASSGGIAAYEDGTKPVATKQPNAWGLYDMHGNVWEWTEDWWAAYTGDVTDPTGPASGIDRVIRGGAWDSGAAGTRSAARYNPDPTWGGPILGFRLVLPPG